MYHTAPDTESHDPVAVIDQGRKRVAASDPDRLRMRVARLLARYKRNLTVIATVESR